MSSTFSENAMDEEENEKQGPKAGIKITREEADLIIQKHFPTRRATHLCHINRGYNNRVYIVTTVDSATSEEKDYIIRLCGRFWCRYKTENEVCVLLYLSNQLPHISVPKIYGFCTDKEKSGINAEYILMEKLMGEPLINIWNDLDLTNRMKIVDQMIAFYGSIKKLTFDKIGSFQFSSNTISESRGWGIILEAEFNAEDSQKEFFKVGRGVEFEEGPFSTFIEYFSSTCETQLDYLRQDKFLKECDGYEERLKRIENFVSAFRSTETLPESIDKEALQNVPIVFTHGDLEPQNILVDKDTMKIMGIVDFEFAGAYPIDEDWYSGFQFIGGADSSEWRAFNDEPDKNKDKMSDEELRIQEMNNSLKLYFFNEMKKHGNLVPENISGHIVRCELYYFRGFISPWWLREEDRKPIPSDHGDRIHAWKRVEAVLNKYGF